jgi:ankyrin repeat protein
MVYDELDELGYPEYSSSEYESDSEGDLNEKLRHYDAYDNMINKFDLTDFPRDTVYNCYHAVSVYKHKGELDELDIDNNCKLELAVKHGNLLMILLLLQNGASYKKWGWLNTLEGQTRDDLFIYIDDWTPLIVAVNDEGIKRNTALKIVKYLLTFDQDLKISDRRHRTAAHWATVRGFPDILQELLVTEPRVVNNFDDRLETMMACAINKWEDTPALSVELVYVLLNNGFDVGTTDASDDTPLHLAVLAGSLEIARILLQNGARTDCENEDRQTPSQVADEMGNNRMVSLLAVGNASAAA